MAHSLCNRLQPNLLLRRGARNLERPSRRNILRIENEELQSQLERHRHSVITTDPVFPNIIYMLQTFHIYRTARNGEPCVPSYFMLTKMIRQRNSCSSIWRTRSNSCGVTNRHYAISKCLLLTRGLYGFSSELIPSGTANGGDEPWNR